MEEVDFFHEICLISLYSSRAVKFAAVVDSKGKLILAKFKKFHIDSHRASLLSARKIQQQDQTLLPQSCHSFCYEHLIPTLKLAIEKILVWKNRYECIRSYYNLL